MSPTRGADILSASAEQTTVKKTAVKNRTAAKAIRFGSIFVSSASLSRRPRIKSTLADGRGYGCPSRSFATASLTSDVTDTPRSAAIALRLP